MQDRPINKYAQFFGILKQHGLEKEDVIAEFTNGRTDSLKMLSDGEFAELMRRLVRLNIKPGDKERKKMIAIAKSMHWGTDNLQVLAHIDNWCLGQKFKKKMMDLTLPELRILLSIFETKVYPDYLRRLNL